MRRASFTSANVVGALTWAVALPIVGYVAYQFPVVRTVAFTIAGIFITISLVGLAVLSSGTPGAVAGSAGRAAQRHHSGVT